MDTRAHLSPIKDFVHLHYGVSVQGGDVSPRQDHVLQARVPREALGEESFACARGSCVDFVFRGGVRGGCVRGGGLERIRGVL